MIRTLTLCVALLVGLYCYDDHDENLGLAPIHVKGITMVAPPDPFPHDPIPPIKDVNANWIAVVPYAFTPNGEASVIYDTPWQWWGEKADGVRESIRVAKNQQMAVMVKPQVYMHGSWVGDLDFEKEEDWQQWEEDYKAYILHFAKIAEEESADMFCVGTECKIAVRKREQFWRELIQEVRYIYQGHLIYSANWDAYETVPIWDAIDFIGISAYFPLSSSKTPSVSELEAAWQPIAERLQSFAVEKQKHVLFTEFGYLTVDHCAHKAWELEPQVGDLAINQQAQANAFDALFSVFWPMNFWAGGFVWKWFPNLQGHEGYIDKDYTPQGKKSHTVIREWYAEKK